MADIQFDESGSYDYAPPAPVASKSSWLIGLVIKTGLASEEKGANLVLKIILAIAIVGIIWLNWPSGHMPSNVPLGPPTPPS